MGKTLRGWLLGLLTLGVIGGFSTSLPATDDLPPMVELIVKPVKVKKGQNVVAFIIPSGGPVDTCTISFGTKSCSCLTRPDTYFLADVQGKFNVDAFLHGPGGWVKRSVPVEVTADTPTPSPPDPTYEGWTIGYTQLFDTSSDIDLFRQYRDEFLAGNKRGKLYTDLLYENSEQALQVLMDNPELMERAKVLLQANQAGIFEVLQGKQAIVNDPDDIVAFLGDFGRKSPPTLKVLAKMVKREMLQKFRQGRPFIGFTRE
jgi:hypothetical protein